MKLPRWLVVAFLLTFIHLANTKSIFRTDDADDLSGDSASLDSTLARIQHLRRTIAALQNAGKAQKMAAEQEKAVGDSKLKQATSSARQAAVLITRANALLKSEADLKSEQVNQWFACSGYFRFLILCGRNTLQMN
jgi:hypothetical protein